MDVLLHGLHVCQWLSWQKWQSIFGKGKLPRIDRWLSGWCDRLVGNSHAVVKFYEQLGVPMDRLAMIYSGADDMRCPPIDRRVVRTELGFNAEAPLILFAGRLAEQKRVDDLLKAASTCCKQFSLMPTGDCRRRSFARVPHRNVSRLPTR